MNNTTNYSFILTVCNGDSKIFSIPRRNGAIDSCLRNIMICGEAFGISSKYYDTYSDMDENFYLRKKALLKKLEISI